MVARGRLTVKGELVHFDRCLIFCYDFSMNTMNKLKLTISPPSKIGDVSIKLNAESFERLAAHFGFFNPDFLKSLRAAERDYWNKKIRKVQSLKEIEARE